MKLENGLSLIELLVAVTIAGILLGSMLFSSSKLIGTKRTETDRDKFATLIQTSRAAAIHLNHPVILCPDDTTGCGARNSWHRGTIAFADKNHNALYDGDDPIVGSLPRLSSDVEWRSFRNRNYLRFLPTGTTDWQNGHFKFCPQIIDQSALQLVLNAAGRLYYSKDEDGDGIHEDVQGRDLSC
ncbi:MAG: prepilin-type N-terminal cleavage/methylation domain-containing protein [Pseudomonadales bacterium]|nr:prepilin-type N-terminal cleavage/methylation domain-containing protein [Pseudomonadales bacterium]